MTHLKHPGARLAYHRKGLRQQLLQAFAFFQPLTEFLGFRLQGGVIQRLKRGFKRVDRRDFFTQSLNDSVVTAADDFLYEVT